MIDRFSRRILTHIKDSRYRPRETRELAKDLGVADEDFEDFCVAVKQLAEEEHIVLGSSNRIALPPIGREMTGSFRLNARGFGFIVPDSPTEHGDLFVPAQNTADAMTGDRVRARVIHEKGRAGGNRSPYIGRILEVIKRADKNYVGNLQRRGRTWFVDVDGNKLPDPVIIRDPDAKNAKVGDKVVIEIIEFPSQNEQAQGVIVEVLGEAGEPTVETQGVMRAYGLVEKFEQSVMDEARHVARQFDDDSVPADRVDFTGTFVCTIDPPDAKDYDDAISIRKFDQPQKGGALYELGVHIADVSNFVTLDTKLDEEAYERGNSTYLPRRVVPMLPELLSNGVCSLQEGVNRFTKTAIIQFDKDGNVVAQRLCNGVIRSAKRMTYLEAQALIDDDLREAKKHAKTEPKYPRELTQTLKLMDELAKVIRARRMRDGMIVLGLPEVELVYDESGRVVDAHPGDDAFTHKIIEMFMVEANEAAARLFDALQIPMIRRIHPDPDTHDTAELKQFARVAGYNIPAKPSRKELQQLLESVRGKPAQQAVHFAVLKTLSKAEYAPLLIGHFALASEHYTHFTSPIRRYPDLIVHRALDAFFEAFPEHTDHWMPPKNQQRSIAKKMGRDKRVPDEDRLAEMGRHCSATERNSEAAERDLRSYLVLEMLADRHMGDDFPGTVTGVTSGGVFMQIDRYLVDGYIRVSDLPSGTGSKRGDRWQLNRTTGALVAQRSGRTIQIGDQFTIRVAKVDPVLRQLDLVIVEDEEGDKSKRKKMRTQPPGARKSHQNDMKFKQLKKHDAKRNRGQKKRRKR